MFQPNSATYISLVVIILALYSIVIHGLSEFHCIADRTCRVLTYTTAQLREIPTFHPSLTPQIIIANRAKYEMQLTPGVTSEGFLSEI